jgi:hypothetical protein
MPQYFGHLTGLDLADSIFDRNLEVTPYVALHTDFNGEQKTELDTGVDVSFRLTPSIITAWTSTRSLVEAGGHHRAAV